MVQIMAWHQRWKIVILTLRNKLKWNVNRNTYIFIQENAFENVVRILAAISSRPQCVNVLISTHYSISSSTEVMQISQRLHIPFTMAQVAVLKTRLFFNLLIFNHYITRYFNIDTGSCECLPSYVFRQTCKGSDTYIFYNHVQYFMNHVLH